MTPCGIFLYNADHIHSGLNLFHQSILQLFPQPPPSITLNDQHSVPVNDWSLSSCSKSWCKNLGNLAPIHMCSRWLWVLTWNESRFGAMGCEMYGKGGGSYLPRLVTAACVVWSSIPAEWFAVSLSSLRAPQLCYLYDLIVLLSAIILFIIHFFVCVSDLDFCWRVSEVVGLVFFLSFFFIAIADILFSPIPAHFLWCWFSSPSS